METFPEKFLFTRRGKCFIERLRFSARFDWVKSREQSRVVASFRSGRYDFNLSFFVLGAYVSPIDKRVPSFHFLLTFLSDIFSIVQQNSTRSYTEAKR